MALRWWKPRRLNQTCVHASTHDYGAIALTIAARSGRRCPGAAANSGEAVCEAEALPSTDSGTGGCGELLGWRWCCCGDGEAARPAGDWQRRWRRAALLLRALRATKEEPEMRKWRRGQERAVAGVIMASSGASWPTWSG